MTTKPRPTAAKPPPGEGEVDDLSIEYPSSDGEPMAEDDAQLTAMLDTIPTLRKWFAHRDDVYAGGDMLVYYRRNDNQTRVAPDVFVVFGVAKHRRRSWIVWREGKAPDLVMEMASGSTWRRDMVEKRTIYANMGVTEYWRYDPSGDYFTPPLVGERLQDGEYVRMPLETDAEGILRGHSPLLALDVCVLPDGNLHFYDPSGGQWLRNLNESEDVVRVTGDALRVSEDARRVTEDELRATGDALRVSEEARRATEDALRASEEARQASEVENRRLLEKLRALQSDQ